MATTVMNNMINPEVLGDMINEKLEAQLKLTPYIKVDKTLVGVPGNTVTVPAWGYIGPADHYNENDPISYTQMSKSTKQFQIGKAGKGVQITTEAAIGGYGKPMDAAARQIAKSIKERFEIDGIEALMGVTPFVPSTVAVIGYNYIVAAVNQFLDEEDGVKKVMFINPEQEGTLLVDSNFLSADKYAPGVMLNGAIGQIAGCQIKKSKRVAKITATVSSSGTAITTQNQATYAGHVWDATNKKVITPAVGTYVTAEANPYYLNPIIKLEPDSAETEYTEDELPALTCYLKKDTYTTSEYDKDHDRYEIVAWKHYGVACTNEEKVVLVKTKA